MRSMIAKHAIYDKNKNIIAYELLYRKSNENYCHNIDDNTATLGVINNIFTIGINNLTQGKLGFINLSRPFLKYELLRLFPKNVIGIEILEDVEPDKELIVTCHRLKKDGYIIALDDFILTNPINPLVEIVDIVKVDFFKSDFQKRKEIVDEIGSYKARFLAEKVESEEDFQQAKDLGYSYFQGYYFSKPEIVMF